MIIIIRVTRPRVQDNNLKAKIVLKIIDWTERNKMTSSLLLFIPIRGCYIEDVSKLADIRQYSSLAEQCECVLFKC